MGGRGTQFIVSRRRPGAMIRKVASPGADPYACLRSLQVWKLKTVSLLIFLGTNSTAHIDSWIALRFRISSSKHK
jgi:hypothetical protein